MCGPLQPGVGYRFHGPQGGFVELLLCFTCREADFIYEGKALRLQLDGLIKRLAPLTLQSFPLDAALADFLEAEDEQVRIPFERDYRPKRGDTFFPFEE